MIICWKMCLLKQFQLFYMYDFDIMNHWNTKSLLLNKMCFHLSLSGCSNGEPGNMHPCNSNASITYNFALVFMGMHSFTIIIYSSSYLGMHKLLFY